jgi:hypothetical protein
MRHLIEDLVNGRFQESHTYDTTRVFRGFPDRHVNLPPTKGQVSMPMMPSLGTPDASGDREVCVGFMCCRFHGIVGSHLTFYIPSRTCAV